MLEEIQTSSRLSDMPHSTMKKVQSLLGGKADTIEVQMILMTEGTTEPRATGIRIVELIAQIRMIMRTAVVIDDRIPSAHDEKWDPVKAPLSIMERELGLHNPALAHERMEERSWVDAVVRENGKLQKAIQNLV